jgi:hypothetical protein
MRLALLLVMLLATPMSALAGPFSRNLEIHSDRQRYALVIGNDHYQSVHSLEKADNDATAVGKALEQIGFQTTVLLDANRRQMNAAINRFVDDIGGGGDGVLFFAGHGVQIDNQNFLLPVDLESPQSAADIGDQAISLQAVQDKIAQVRARFALLVIDACRDNPLPKRAGRGIGATRGLAQASSAEGQMVIFSAGANQQALDKLSPDDPNPNGVFTRELLPWLGKPGVSVRQAVLEVRRAVYARAKSLNHDQFPAVYDQVLGDFYFVPARGEPAPATMPTVLAPQRQVLPVVVASIPPTPLPAALVPSPAKPSPGAPTPSAGVQPARSLLALSALGLPSRRSFWSRETADGYTRRMRAALEPLSGDLLAMAVENLELDQSGFDDWWNESPEQRPRSRALCATSPAPRILFGAHVETPPVFFTNSVSAYWPELKMRLIVCADLRSYSQRATLSPHQDEAWPFAAELNGEVDKFLRANRGNLAE